MRAIVCSPASPGRIAFREVAGPSPGRDEAIVEVRAVSLNRGEFRRLQWATDGWRPGYDVAGVVIASAEDGSGPPSGTRVAGLLPEGAWAEQVAIATGRLAPLPAELDFVAASTVPVAGLTSLAALAHFGPLPGKRVLITGAAGGVGRFAIQLATLMGGRVTALVGSRERGQGLEALGAERIVTELGAGTDEFDAVLESVGGEVLGAALARLATNGCLVMIGGSSDMPTTFDGLALARKGPVTVYGMSLFRELERQGMGSVELGRLLDLVAGGRLDPQVDRVASWREMPSLLAALGKRRIAGKAVATVD
jgi:NADPH:quinone reductase-like Zn-dependent oxidoreductase